MNPICLFFALSMFSQPLPETAAGKDVDGSWAQGQQIVLTFDDGPDHQTTPVLLDYLDDLGVKAIFFVNGRRFTGRLPLTHKNRAVLLETHRRGHIVANHTQTHPMMNTISPGEQYKEIQRTHDAITRVTGTEPWLYRPPFGQNTGAARAILQNKKYTIVMWNLDSNDPFERHANLSYRNVMKDIAQFGRGVTLFHDTNAWSVDAVPRIIRSVYLDNCLRAVRDIPVREFSNEIEPFWQPRSGIMPEPSLGRLQEAARRRQYMTSWCANIRKGVPQK